MCPFIAQPLPHTPPPPSETSTPSLVVPVMTPKFAFETFEHFLMYRCHLHGSIEMSLFDSPIHKIQSGDI